MENPHLMDITDKPPFIKRIMPNLAIYIGLIVASYVLSWIMTWNFPAIVLLTGVFLFLVGGLSRNRTGREIGYHGQDNRTVTNHQQSQQIADLAENDMPNRELTGKLALIGLLLIPTGIVIFVVSVLMR